MIDGRLYKADAYGTGDHSLSFECINLQKESTVISFKQSLFKQFWWKYFQSILALENLYSVVLYAR